MKTFLGVIIVLIVCGHSSYITPMFAFVAPSDCKNVSSILGGSVLLPCSCPQREVNEVFHWQMETPAMVFKYSNGTSTFSDRYKGRGKIFLPEHCSVLLTNITADDQGIYRCTFKSQGRLKKIFVNLNVNANYNVCQMNYNGSSECGVKGRYRDAEIQWALDGRPLTSSPTTNVILNDSTGLYHFTSIISGLNGTSSPTCTVKAKGVSATIIYDCKTEKSELLIRDKTPLRYRCLKIIPIVSLLGFFLVLWRRWKF